MRDDVATSFPRQRLFWRCCYSTEAAMGRLPMLVLIPTAGAIAGTAWGVSHPSRDVVVHGLIVGGASFGHVLVAALVGGVAGFFMLVGLMFCCVWFWYRFLGGDKVWEAAYQGAAHGRMVFELRNRKGFIADPQHLGVVECLLRTPGGVVDYDGPLLPRHSPHGVVARFDLDPVPGVYEVRWFGAREGEKLHEVARVKVKIGDEVQVSKLEK